MVPLESLRRSGHDSIAPGRNYWGVARSLSSIVTVWNDRVLCLAAGWRRIPDETTFGRILRTFTQRNINDMETLNHRIRASIWRSALQLGSSMVRASPRIVIDVDSTVKTVYGNQQGVSVGYNPHKCGAASYHPLLAQRLAQPTWSAQII